MSTVFHAPEPRNEVGAIRKRMPAIEIYSGQKAVIQHHLKDTEGNPIILQTGNYLAQLRMREDSFTIQPRQPTIVNGNVLSTNPVFLEFHLTQEQTALPGIYRSEIAVGISSQQPDEEEFIPLHIQPVWIIINRSMYVEAANIFQGPPSIAEIRLAIRDSGGEDNLWRALEEFDNAEIALCIRRPVEAFNELPPPISIRFTTTNFPYRYYWLQGIIAHLYLLAARHYRRVHLPYQSAGLTVMDKAKADEYERTGLQTWQEYMQWARYIKVQLNMNEGYGEVQSPYSRYLGWW